LTKVDEITDLALLDQTFPGGRPTATGKHIKWDVLFIRVKPAKRQLHLVPKESQIEIILTYFSENSLHRLSTFLTPPIHPSGQLYAALPKAHV